jgi:hypothetical protein
MQKLSAGKFHFEPPFQVTSFNHLVGVGEQGWPHFLKPNTPLAVLS